ncbi:isochorismate synthase [Robertmurraya massiliosenegalensis]|uniref:isochorismate synthase n=1 Tax=Robertmurraya TaxID=2837507 RepID=UPI0039A5BE92
MVTILETELKKGIEQAIERAKKSLVPILVSEVQKIDHIEPLSFFRAGQEKFLGERFFWKDPDDETYLIGLGISEQIQTDKISNRFEMVEKEWNNLTKNAIIFNSEDKKGTGPIMFGGFSFDPLKETTSLWSKYAHSLFHIPQFLLTVMDGEAYLTTNVFCTKHDDLTMWQKVIQERQKILSLASLSVAQQEATIIDNKEVVDADQWIESVKNLVADLKAGELKKVVLARELRLYFNNQVSIDAVLQRLLQEQRASFTFAFESNGDCFIGASPERLVKKEKGKLYSTCLAGSIARGKTEDEDERLGDTLLNDDKNLIEHQYVVEMIKAAMEKACQKVELPNHPSLLKMRDIQHLYTPIIGTSLEESSLLQVVDSLHPTPALGGLPQREAVAKIRKIEELDRGFYAAPLGWLDYQGNGEFAVAIRCALIQGNEASLFAGCGIVQDSDANSEYVETNIKFRPMLSALGGLDK